MHLYCSRCLLCGILIQLSRTTRRSTPPPVLPHTSPQPLSPTSSHVGWSARVCGVPRARGRRCAELGFGSCIGFASWPPSAFPTSHSPLSPSLAGAIAQVGVGTLTVSAATWPREVSWPLCTLLSLTGFHRTQGPQELGTRLARGALPWQGREDIQGVKGRARCAGVFALKKKSLVPSQSPRNDSNGGISDARARGGERAGAQMSSPSCGPALAAAAAHGQGRRCCPVSARFRTGQCPCQAGCKRGAVRGAATL